MRLDKKVIKDNTILKGDVIVVGGDAIYMVIKYHSRYTLVNLVTGTSVDREFGEIDDLLSYYNLNTKDYRIIKNEYMVLGEEV